MGFREIQSFKEPLPGAFPLKPSELLPKSLNMILIDPPPHHYEATPHTMPVSHQEDKLSSTFPCAEGCHTEITLPAFLQISMLSR